ncbi:hypothetical protein [Amycolatopsis jejuensis]|uniref:hypothetical protein n=1 Tax=Amycolatopsis jejuensis TaxID=330084 RepID=UPI000524B8A2|nr:hypothetical protein [Amycolatopsis jejuensis]
MILGNHLFTRDGGTGSVPHRNLQQPHVRKAFRVLKGWNLAYLATSVLALIASFVLPEPGGSAIGVWIRCGVVTLIAALIYFLTTRAGKGDRRAYRTLTVVAYLESIGFLVVALIVPGYPLWLRAAQIVVGVFAIGTALATSNRQLRQAFAVDPVSPAS